VFQLVCTSFDAGCRRDRQIFFAPLDRADGVLPEGGDLASPNVLTFAGHGPYGLAALP